MSAVAFPMLETCPPTTHIHVEDALLLASDKCVSDDRRLLLVGDGLITSHTCIRNLWIPCEPHDDALRSDVRVIYYGLDIDLLTEHEHCKIVLDDEVVSEVHCVVSFTTPQIACENSAEFVKNYAIDFMDCIVDEERKGTFNYTEEVCKALVAKVQDDLMQRNGLLHGWTLKSYKTTCPQWSSFWEWTRKTIARRNRRRVRNGKLAEWWDPPSPSPPLLPPPPQMATLLQATEDALKTEWRRR